MPPPDLPGNAAEPWSAGANDGLHHEQKRKKKNARPVPPLSMVLRSHSGRATKRSPSDRTSQGNEEGESRPPKRPKRTKTANLLTSHPRRQTRRPRAPRPAAAPPRQARSPSPPSDFAVFSEWPLHDATIKCIELNGKMIFQFEFPRNVCHHTKHALSEVRKPVSRPTERHRQPRSRKST